MKKQADRTFKINPEIACRELKGQLLFLRPDDRQLYTTNATGLFIWRQLVRRASLDKINGLFQKEYAVSADIAARDVRKFLGELEKKRIILRTTGK